MTRLIFIIPLALLMMQAGMVVTACIYYIMIRHIVNEKRPIFWMGISYLSSILVMAADIAEHSRHNPMVDWRPILFIAVSVFGLATTRVVIVSEVRQLRSLEAKDRARLESQVWSIRARVQGMGAADASRHDTTH